MKKVARILLLVLIIAFSLRLVDVTLAMLASREQANNFSYTMGRFAVSFLLLAFLVTAFRRMGPGKGRTPPPLPGHGG
jgi:hypothetical protein